MYLKFKRVSSDLRGQGLRNQKQFSPDLNCRPLGNGNLKEHNLILKREVDGSVEALADSLLKLSTEEIQVNVIHKSVGQISESDVLLASASDAIILGFQVRPSPQARRLAEQEEIEIGRAHVRTPVTNAHLVCRLLLEKKKKLKHNLRNN